MIDIFYKTFFLAHCASSVPVRFSLRRICLLCIEVVGKRRKREGKRFTKYISYIIVILWGKLYLLTASVPCRYDFCCASSGPVQFLLRRFPGRYNSCCASSVTVRFLMRRIWGKSEARREGEYIVYKVHELYNHYCLEKVLFGCASSLPVRFLMRQFRDGTILAAPDLGFPWRGGKRHRVQAGPVRLI